MAVSSKIFKNESELANAINEEIRKAMENTLNKMKEKLGEFIEEDVYSYDSKWYRYRRTDFLRDNYERIFETYFWNDFGRGVKGGIRVHTDMYFPSYPEDFIHGSQTENNYNSLNLESYLEIMNNPDVIPSTRFNFPTNFTMHKRPFWDDFLDWAKTHFREIFEEEFYKVS